MQLWDIEDQRKNRQDIFGCGCFIQQWYKGERTGLHSFRPKLTTNYQQWNSHPLETFEKSDVIFALLPATGPSLRLYSSQFCFHILFRLETAQVNSILRLEESDARGPIFTRNSCLQEEQMLRLLNLCFCIYSLSRFVMVYDIFMLETEASINVIVKFSLHIHSNCLFLWFFGVIIGHAIFSINSFPIHIHEVMKASASMFIPHTIISFPVYW